VHNFIKDIKVTLEVFGGFKVKPMEQITTILTLETEFIVIEDIKVDQ